MLSRRFNFNIKHIPREKSKLSDALSKQSDGDVFKKNPVEADAFLPFKNTEFERQDFMVVLNVVDFCRRVVEC
jgi:hypothetical protein